MPLNVLVTAASRRVALVRGFRAALRPHGGRVIVCDVNPLSPAVHMADAAYRVPPSDDPEYLDRILDLCDVENIDLIVPTIDDELPLFGASRAMFGRAGVKIAASPEATALRCNDKHALCEHLRSRRISAARSWLPSTLPSDPEFPLFIKPRMGRGGVNAFPVRSRRELEFFLDYVDDPVVQEFLTGPEFTIDLLCGFDGVPRAIVPRERVTIRAGVMDRGRTVSDSSLTGLALACAGALEFVGAVNIQCRMVDGRPVVFEINPRFSGGIPLTIAAGADFPKMLVDLALGRHVPASIGQFQADLWMTSYEEGVYLDSSRTDVLKSLNTDVTRAAREAAARRVA